MMTPDFDEKDPRKPPGEGGERRRGINKIKLLANAVPWQK
jgi:hypothetical protein